MAGSAGTSLPSKLGIKAGCRLALVRAPEGFEQELDPLPDGVRLRTQARSAEDVIVFFATRHSELERRFAKLARSLTPTGRLWIAWPKRTAGVVTDLSEQAIRDIGLDAGLVDGKVFAVNEAWSGLRFEPPDEAAPATVKARSAAGGSPRRAAPRSAAPVQR